MKTSQLLLLCLCVISVSSGPAVAQTSHQHGAPAQPAEAAPQEVAEPSSLAERLTSIAAELAAGDLTPERLQELSETLRQSIPQTAADVAEPDAESGQPSESAGMTCTMCAKMSGGMKSCKMMSGEMSSDGMMSEEMKSGMRAKMMHQAHSGSEPAGPTARPHVPFADMLPMLGDHADALTMRMHGEILTAIGDIMIKYGDLMAAQPQPAAEIEAE